MQKGVTQKGITQKGIRRKGIKPNLSKNLTLLLVSLHVLFLLHQNKGKV